MKKPDFIIIGAPKCGTTSLAAWLGQHPRVFMSTPKELEFFKTDFILPFKDDLARYEALFRHAEPHLNAIGEASTAYLRSWVSVSTIMAYNQDARFIVCVRNPIEMTFSMHCQLLFEVWEDELDFQKAWEVPRSRILAISLDDMRADTDAVYQKMLIFLGVEDDDRQSFPIPIEAKSVPKWLALMIRKVADTKRRWGVYHGIGILNDLARRLARKPDNAIDQATYLKLREYFRADVERLGQLLDRDFSHWIDGLLPARMTLDRKPA